MLQLCLLAPVALTVLDVSTSGETTVWWVRRQPLRNPLIIGSLLGLIVALLPWRPPEAVFAPFELVGGGAVPVILLSFGMSLAGSRILNTRHGRADILVAVALKVVVMPLIAWVTAYFGFDMRGKDLFAAVALSALPSAQNVFNYAQRYGRAVLVARDTVFITTILSVPVLAVIALLLAS